MTKIVIKSKFAKIDKGTTVVDTTSRASTSWEKTLSPFYLGPIDLYDGGIAKNLENAWQFSKVYRGHTDKNEEPTSKYWDWAKNGWDSRYAHRYPMGKGSIPLYSLWDGQKLRYIEARKKIYGPLYTRYVQYTEGYHKLKDIYLNEESLTLLDFDGYDHEELEMTLTDVLHCESRKMGHAFFLKALLTNDPMLDYLEVY